jgi:hypothetical protein
MTRAADSKLMNVNFTHWDEALGARAVSSALRAPHCTTVKDKAEGVRAEPGKPVSRLLQ